MKLHFEKEKKSCKRVCYILKYSPLLSSDLNAAYIECIMNLSAVKRKHEEIFLMKQKKI